MHLILENLALSAIVIPFLGFLAAKRVGIWLKTPWIYNPSILFRGFCVVTIFLGFITAWDIQEFQRNSLLPFLGFLFLACAMGISDIYSGRIWNIFGFLLISLGLLLGFADLPENILAFALSVFLAVFLAFLGPRFPNLKVFLGVSDAICIAAAGAWLGYLGIAMSVMAYILAVFYYQIFGEKAGKERAISCPLVPWFLYGIFFGIFLLTSWKFFVFLN